MIIMLKSIADSYDFAHDDQNTYELIYFWGINRFSSSEEKEIYRNLQEIYKKSMGINRKSTRLYRNL